MKIVKRVVKFIVIMSILFMLLNVFVYTYAKLSPKIQIKSANSFALYDKDKQMFFQGSESKEWINLEEISPYLVDATLSIEDKHFFSHHGFDFLRIAKALYINITSGSKKQGASTISQQYAKNLFLDFDKTWQRKLKEMWLTLKLETHYSKEEILEGYLNTINYGHGMYGIENAAKYYFNKSATNLSLAEATMLTGIPKSPSNYSPLVNFDLAKSRQLIILNSMVKNKMITQEEADLAYLEELNFTGKRQYVNLSTIMYYQDAVIKELKTISSIPSSYLDTGGLKIYTTLDINAQTLLEENVKEIMPDNTLQTAAIMMDPNTGGVIALIGGRDYNASQFNRAIQAKRQVGSTMKPYLYYSALENGFTSSTTFTSEETTFTFSGNKSYSPQNYNAKYGHKPISMATAIAYSENIYAVKTHMFLGENSLVDMAKRVGITAELDPIPSLALGTGEISVLEMAAGYSAFANEGYKVKPHFITKIEDGYGNILYEYKEEKEAVLNKSLTFILNNLLTSTYDTDFIDYNYPTAVGIKARLTNKYALKSGTTNTDNWYIGYTPEVVTTVWVGYDNNQALEVSEYKYAQNIWVNSMEDYFKDKEATWYTMPSNVVGILVEPISGKPATESSPKKKVMYFIKGTDPSREDPVFDEYATTD